MHYIGFSICKYKDTIKVGNYQKQKRLFEKKAAFLLFINKSTEY